VSETNEKRNWWVSLCAAWGPVGRKIVTGGVHGWLDEILLTTALALIVVGLWPVAARWIGTGVPALSVAGIILLYVVLPPRAPFVDRPTSAESSSRRSD